MESLLKKHATFIVLGLLTLFAAYLHLYNLNWGAPYYFHPDERNIAFAVTQLSFPKQMNPHFFAYGSLPIYTIYFAGVINNIFGKLFAYISQPSIYSISFENAIILGRLYSFVFSVLLIPLFYLLGKMLKSTTTGFIAAFLGATSVGLTQFAHFGTFELWLTFFTVLLFFCCLSYYKKSNLLLTVLLGILSGGLVAIKISHLALFPVPFFVIILTQYVSKKTAKKKLIKTISDCLICLAAALFVYILTNPFVALDPAAQSSLHYESQVALGTLPVFYTGEFARTIPVLYQFFYIYPFLLNPLLTILLIPSLCYLVFLVIKKKHIPLLLLGTFFLILFLSQAFIFAKWTRYMVPTLPFIYLIVAFGMSDFLLYLKKMPSSKYFAVSVFVVVTIVFCLSYFITAFIEPDTRVVASNFAKETIAPNAMIMSEVYDLGIVPFNNTFSNITLVNTYDLDNTPAATSAVLDNALKQSTYIILPSQRILKTRINNVKAFPYGYTFYNSLVNGKLGYKEIYETPCDIFCQITYLGNPVSGFEGTANIFDRPTVFIFKKDQ